MKTAGVSIDNWKLKIFEEVLAKAGYTYDIHLNFPTKDCMLLTVEVPDDDLEKLGVSVEEANNKAAKSKRH